MLPLSGEKESKTLEQRISNILLSKLVIENKKGIPYAVKEVIALLKAEAEKAWDAAFFGTELYQTASGEMVRAEIPGAREKFLSQYDKP